ncbi:MAG: hypothetical protein ACFFDN_39415 [Candidatus Hodarchaeota archaeon]
MSKKLKNSNPTDKPIAIKPSDKPKAPLPLEESSLEKDPGKGPGVLLSDEITYLAKNYELIKPFEKKHLKPAGYELTIGKEYAKDGKVITLSPGREKIIIEPFQCVIISSTEKIKMPRFLIARWNLRVRWAYEGLLWLGAAQVDPGYEGHLFCPIFNLSDKNVILKHKEQIALIDFIKTTPFDKGKSLPYKRETIRETIHDYNIDLRSALFTEVGKRIANIEEKTKIDYEKFKDNLSNLSSTIFTLISILIAALSIIVSLNYSTNLEQIILSELPFWAFISLPFSIFAFIFALIALILRRKN